MEAQQFIENLCEEDQELLEEIIDGKISFSMAIDFIINLLEAYTNEKMDYHENNNR